MKELRRYLTPLAREIKELHDGDDLPASQFLGLCERYFAEVEALLERHDAFSGKDPANLRKTIYDMSGTEPGDTDRHRPRA